MPTADLQVRDGGAERAQLRDKGDARLVILAIPGPDANDERDPPRRTLPFRRLDVERRAVQYPIGSGCGTRPKDRTILCDKITAEGNGDAKDLGMVQGDIGGGISTFREASDGAVRAIGNGAILAVDKVDKINSNGILHALAVVIAVGPGRDTIDRAVAVWGDEDRLADRALGEKRIGSDGGVSTAKPVRVTARTAVQQVQHGIPPIRKAVIGGWEINAVRTKLPTQGSANETALFYYAVLGGCPCAAELESAGS